MCVFSSTCHALDNLPVASATVSNEPLLLPAPAAGGQYMMLPAGYPPGAFVLPYAPPGGAIILPPGALAPRVETAAQAALAAAAAAHMAKQKPKAAAPAINQRARAAVADANQAAPADAAAEPYTEVQDEEAGKLADPTSKRRPWCAEEDLHLKGLVDQHGIKSWAIIASFLPQRNGKQCRERWRHHLRPGLTKGEWTAEEEEEIWTRVLEFGTKWVRRARSNALSDPEAPSLPAPSAACTPPRAPTLMTHHHLPIARLVTQALLAEEYMVGRTENDIKNRWNSIVRRPLAPSGRAWLPDENALRARYLGMTLEQLDSVNGWKRFRAPSAPPTNAAASVLAAAAAAAAAADERGVGADGVLTELTNADGGGGGKGGKAAKGGKRKGAPSSSAASSSSGEGPLRLRIKLSGSPDLTRDLSPAPSPAPPSPTAPPHADSPTSPPSRPTPKQQRTGCLSTAAAAAAVSMYALGPSPPKLTGARHLLAEATTGAAPPPHQPVVPAPIALSVVAAADSGGNGGGASPAEGFMHLLAAAQMH